MKIVVSVVRSRAGDRALELAEQEALARNAELILVGTAAVSESAGEELEALQAYLSELEARFGDEGIPTTSEWAVSASSSAAVIDAAKKHSADFIVLGLRRRSAVGKALLGSYEQEVLLTAPCPVISTVPPLPH